MTTLTEYKASTTSYRPPVRCSRCGKVIFDGDVVKSRVVKVLDNHTEAKCQCKAWVRVPLSYSQER
jgi:RNase P subunit RPR2